MKKQAPASVSEGEVITIELPNRIVKLKITSFDTDIDTDQLTQIQYHNIMGEILTSAVVLNRVGNLKAEMENLVREAQLDFDIFYAQQGEAVRKTLTFESLDTKGQPKTVKPTVQEVEDAIVRTPNYKVMKKKLFEIQKNLAYIESLYWSARSKDEKLNKLTEKLRPDEFEKELLEDRINGVQIILMKKAIK